MDSVFLTGARMATRFDLQHTLCKVFRHDRFRPHQEEIIEQVLARRNTLAVLPSGHGKSLCYQLPAYLFQGTTLVFSPLIALMKDQIDALNRKFNIPSVSLNHEFLTADPQGYEEALAALAQGRYKIVFIAPERLDARRDMEILRRMRTSLVVVDEAHCISLWGHDFRPHYRRVLDFAHSLGEVPILAVTATAPPAVEQDIARQLGEGAQVIRASSYRDNLRLHVIRVKGMGQKYAALEQIIGKLQGSGIVYVGTHEECERTTAFLNFAGIRSKYYHAGLKKGRSEIQEGFMQDRWPVTVATCALGMGVDKPNLRFIIHFRFPSCPEIYYQEIGRAGRDRKPADCILLFDPKDVRLQEHFLDVGYPTPAQVQAVARALSSEEPKRPRQVALETELSTEQVNNILFHLVDQGVVRTAAREGEGYLLGVSRRRMPDLAEFEHVRAQRIKCLQRMIDYSRTKGCLMEYLCRYLGDSESQACGHCSTCKGYPYDSYLQLTPKVKRFQKEWRPSLEASGRYHAGGFCLDYYSETTVGTVVAQDKYGTKTGFRQWLVDYAKDVIQEKYPLGDIDLVCSVPSTKKRNIVRGMAKRLAESLHLPYLEPLSKTRSTEPQKAMRTRAQKQDNIKGAFQLLEPEAVEGKTILLVDDIYDSGWTLRECARTLSKAKPGAVHIFTLVRTQHIDDL